MGEVWQPAEGAMMLFLDFGSDIVPGDLVEVSSIAGLSLILVQENDSPGGMIAEDRLLPVTAIYLGHCLKDYGIDRENVPVVLHNGMRMTVGRGCVRRVPER